MHKVRKIINRPTLLYNIYSIVQVSLHACQSLIYTENLGTDILIQISERVFYPTPKKCPFMSSL